MPKTAARRYTPTQTSQQECCVSLSFAPPDTCPTTMPVQRIAGGAATRLPYTSAELAKTTQVVQRSQTNLRHAPCNIHSTPKAHELIDSGNASSVRRLRCFVMSGPGLFVVAIAVRLLHLWAIRHTAFFDVLMGDARATTCGPGGSPPATGSARTSSTRRRSIRTSWGALRASSDAICSCVRLVQAVVGSAAVVAARARRRAALLAARGPRRRPDAGAVRAGDLLRRPAAEVGARRASSCACRLGWSSRLVDRPGADAVVAGLGVVMGALSLTRENALVLVGWWSCGAWSPDSAGRPAPQQPAGSGIPDSGSRARAFVGLCPRPGDRAAAGRRPQLRRRRRLLSDDVAVRTELLHRQQPGADGTYMSLRPGRGAPEYERQDATELAEHARGGDH